MRVGRDALDAEAIRLIEQHHPEIRFDWPQILNGEEEVLPPEPPPPPRRPEREQPHHAAAPQSRPAPSSAPPPILPDDQSSAAYARIGAEGLTRLRARHAEVLSAIERRSQHPSGAPRSNDEQRHRQLLEQAARLNPDAWLTDADVVRGLEDYESVLAALRDAVGRRRRRKRGRPGSGGGAPGAADSMAPGQDETPQADAPQEDDGETE